MRREKWYFYELVSLYRWVVRVVSCFDGLFQPHAATQYAQRQCILGVFCIVEYIHAFYLGLAHVAICRFIEPGVAP